MLGAPRGCTTVRSIHRILDAPRGCTTHAWNACCSQKSYGPWIACVLLPGAGDARPMHRVLTQPLSTLTDMKLVPVLAPCGHCTCSARDAAAEHWDTGSHRVSQSEQKQVDGAAREHRWAQVTAKTRSFLQPTHAPSVSVAMQRNLPLLQSPHAHAVGDHLFSNRLLLAPSSTSSPIE